VRWSNRATVPILSCTRRGKKERRPAPRDTTIRRAERRQLPPRSRTVVAVTTPVEGQILVRPYNRLNTRHGCQTGYGLAVSFPGERFHIELLNLSDTPVCLRKGTVLATAEATTDVPWNMVSDDGPPLSGPPKKTFLEEIDLSNVPARLRDDVQALLTKNAHMLDGTLGSIEATKHRIDLLPGAEPIRQQPYRAGHHARDIIRDEVNRMLEAGVIRPSTSEWASPVVVVPKKDGSPRFCVDYRRLNAVTRKDSYPIPRMEDCFDSLEDARIFSTLDCSAGYWQIPMAYADIAKTAFTCHMGIYEYLKMAFGLTNAPATFQRALDIIMSGMTWQSCLVYLDDVIVFSATPEDHLAALDEVLTRLGRAGVTLKAKKCRFFQASVVYLGHVISPGEMRVHNKNLEALAKATHPRTKTQLRSVLGMCNVYRRFMRGYSTVAAPLTKMTSNDHDYKLPLLNEVQAAAFEQLRDALLRPLVLALPRRGAPFVIDVDACDTQLGCALLQEQPDGELKPVGFYSRALEAAERNYSASKRECLGLVWAVLHLRHYVEGNHFTVRTDHECLSWIYRLTTASGRLLRWRLRLAEFDFDVKYKKGASHHLPDALSRLPSTGKTRRILTMRSRASSWPKPPRASTARNTRGRPPRPRSPWRHWSGPKTRTPVASPSARTSTPRSPPTLRRTTRAVSSASTPQRRCPRCTSRWPSGPASWVWSTTPGGRATRASNACTR